MQIRLQKFLADSGVASRRASEKLISMGKVKVNNKIVAQLGIKVDPEKDIVHYNNKPVKLPVKPVYLMLNKPKGYLTTVKDPQNRKTVMSLLPKNLKVHPIGRLDKDSEGLLILTNDGGLTQQLTHPKFEHQKEYVVKVRPKADQPLAGNKFNKLDKLISLLKSGVKLEEGIVRADQVNRITNRQFRITIHQGWKRQIRRMCEALGYDVVSLKRIRVGKLKLGSLANGEHRFIKKEDIIADNH
ncbi:rRNA pseudouridine synthase [Patescibacteria group bacterium]|nr:rRNA pseudouridine synthase [Patescibacteria group bacterium]